MHALACQDAAMLDGGVAAWEAAGYRAYSGVHVPSKAFAEVVEHEAGTPYRTAPELNALIDNGTDIIIFDSRSYEEHRNNSIRDAVSVPGAEVVYSFKDLAPSPDTTVIVNCGIVPGVSLAHSRDAMPLAQQTRVAEGRCHSTWPGTKPRMARHTSRRRARSRD